MRTRVCLLIPSLLCALCLAQPERSELGGMPADPIPGGAACGQRSGCYKPGGFLNSNTINKCERCCVRNDCLATGPNNCFRGCAKHLAPKTW